MEKIGRPTEYQISLSSLQVSVPDPNIAKFVEHFTVKKYRLAFVVQNQDDQDTLVNEIRERQKLSINVLRAPSVCVCA